MFSSSLSERYKVNQHSKEDFSQPPEPYPKEIVRFIPAMKAYLHGRNLSYETAKGNLWYPTNKIREKDPVPRIVIPCKNPYNRPYWQGRALLDHDLRYRSAKGGRFGSIVVVWPVYISPLEIVSRSARKPVVLVEGPMDALAAAGLGFLSIATMGALFSSYAIDYIEVNVDKEIAVIVVPDLDCPEFATENVRKLAAAGREVVMRLPVGGNDLAKMSVKARKRLLSI